MRVLVVEDDPRIRRDVGEALTAAGFLVEVAGDGTEALFRGDTEDYDLVVLDLGLPQLDGLSVLRRWRDGGRDMPVLALTARGTWSERVEGIEAGADDYLSKPFHMEELVARARALMRRSAGHGSAVQRHGELRLDANQMRLTRAGQPILMTALEYRLVAYLFHCRDRTVPVSELLEHVYGDDDGRDINAIEAMITRLRRKMGRDTIRNRRGFGYYLDAPAP
jgi:DNA-binding response OmpR family regulator